jgi:hypothetical protein
MTVAGKLAAHCRSPSPPASSRNVSMTPVRGSQSPCDRGRRLARGDAGVERGRLQLRVAQQHLDHANVDALLEQVGREPPGCDPGGMRRNALGDARQLLGGGDGAADLMRGDRVDRVLAGKEPDLRPRRLPPFAQELEQLRRQHHVAVPLSLALLDPEHHALAVDVRHLQVRDLGHPEARAVGDAERGLVLEARRGLEEARHLLLAQDDRRLARLGHDPQRTNEVWFFERHGEKEPQRRDGGVDRRGAGLLLRHVQLIAAKVLARRRARRPAEEGCELPHVTDVVPLRVFAVPASRHVVDQALAQRADGLLGHGKLLSHMGWNPTILRQRRAFGLSLHPRARRPLAAPTAGAV